MTYSSGFLQRDGQSPHRMRSNARTSSLNWRTSGIGSANVSVEKARSTRRIALPHFREPRGTMACAPFSNIRNAVGVFIFVLPERAPQCNRTAKLTALPMRQEAANPYFNTQGVHPRALVDAADTSPAASRAARLCPPEACGATHSTTKGEKARQPAPRCRLVETAQDHPCGLFSIAPGQVGQVFSVVTSNRERSEFTPPRPNDPTQRFRKQGVGGFHSSDPMLRQTSPLEAL